MPELETLERMREDWNRRAREDAHYYVAFGRHNQDDDEFRNVGAKKLQRIGAPAAKDFGNTLRSFLRHQNQQGN